MLKICPNGIELCTSISPQIDIRHKDEMPVPILRMQANIIHLFASAYLTRIDRRAGSPP